MPTAFQFEEQAMVGKKRYGQNQAHDVKRRNDVRNTEGLANYWVKSDENQRWH